MMPCVPRQDPQFRTLGDMLVGQQGRRTVIREQDKVGWKELDLGPSSPRIDVNSAQAKRRVGAGARVVRRIQVPILGTLSITGMAQAYVVEDSGIMGTQTRPDTMGQPRPVFKPTFWVKLSGAK